MRLLDGLAERTAWPRPYLAAQPEGNRSSALGCPPPDRAYVPASLHPNVGFVHPPGAVASFANAGGFAFQAPLRRPGSIGRSSCRSTSTSAVEEHEFQIAVADREHQIPSHGPKDRLSCELPPLEAITQTHTNARPKVPPQSYGEVRQQQSLQQYPLDGYAASHRAVRELKADGLLPAETKLRSSKYLNNLIEQDHRGVKQRIATMLGFKGFATAAITIAGIELMHRIRKGQFRTGTSGRPARSTCACSVECRAPSLKSRQVQHGTLSGTGYLHPEPPRAGFGISPVTRSTA